jgi:hypothetical protein
MFATGSMPPLGTYDSRFTDTMYHYSYHIIRVMHGYGETRGVYTRRCHGYGYGGLKPYPHPYRTRTRSVAGFVMSVVPRGINYMPDFSNKFYS